MHSAPYEIIAAPFTLWVAVIGTAFPLIDAAPAAAWVKVGTSGDLNYGEDGVTVQHGQSIELWRALGDTGPRKAFRTAEDLIINLMLMDLTLEQYAIALNHNAVTTTAPGAGTAGTKHVKLRRGLSVERRALLVRGVSPYGEWNMQYEVPVAVQTAEPEIVYRKNEPAGIALQWTALIDSTAAEADRFGRLIAQNADAI